jgi:hypothetical protein
MACKRPGVRVPLAPLLVFSQVRALIEVVWNPLGKTSNVDRVVTFRYWRWSECCN